MLEIRPPHPPCWQTRAHFMTRMIERINCFSMMHTSTGKFKGVKNTSVLLFHKLPVFALLFKMTNDWLTISDRLLIKNHLLGRSGSVSFFPSKVFKEYSERITQCPVRPLFLLIEWAAEYFWLDWFPPYIPCEKPLEYRNDLFYYEPTVKVTGQIVALNTLCRYWVQIFEIGSPISKPSSI